MSFRLKTKYSKTIEDWEFLQIIFLGSSYLGVFSYYWATIPCCSTRPLYHQYLSSHISPAGKPLPRSLPKLAVEYVAVQVESM